LPDISTYWKYWKVFSRFIFPSLWSAVGRSKVYHVA